MEYKYRYVLTKELYKYNNDHGIDNIVELEKDTYKEVFSSYELVEVQKKYCELIENYGKVNKEDKMTCCLRIYEETIHKEHNYRALTECYNEVLLKEEAY